MAENEIQADGPETIEQLALAVIETVLAERAASRDLTRDATEEEKREDWLYRIAHAGDTLATCFDVHGDWREELFRAGRDCGFKFDPDVLLKRRQQSLDARRASSPHQTQGNV